MCEKLCHRTAGQLKDKGEVVIQLCMMFGEAEQTSVQGKAVGELWSCEFAVPGGFLVEELAGSLMVRRTEFRER